MKMKKNIIRGSRFKSMLRKVAYGLSVVFFAGMLFRGGIWLFSCWLEEWITDSFLLGSLVILWTFFVVPLGSIMLSEMLFRQK